MSKELLRADQFRKAQSNWDQSLLQLNPEQKNELAQLYQGTLDSFKSGNIIKGTILQITSDGVLIDINFKSDGLISLHEFSDFELKQLAPGTQIDVIIDELENIDGNVILSYEKAKAARAWDNLLKLHADGKPVEGVVTNKVKGGLSVDIGISAFLPGSQVDIQRVTNFDQFIGQSITAYIIKVNQKRGNVIISRRKFLNEQRSETRKKVLDVLQVAQVIQGIVKNITKYGAFIDIGGVDGLLHITDMTWGRIAHPSELLQIGDTITVKVLSIDKINEKISLGLKQLDGNPWEKLNDTIQIGSAIKGTISSITDYGIFVEVAKGVEGLIHISEVSWTDRIKDLNKQFKVGEQIEALVVSLDKENRRLSLSIKQMEKNPLDAIWDKVEQEFHVGQRVKGKVTNITDFGIFVQLLPPTDDAPGVDGLVHISDFSWTDHIKHPSDLYKKSDEVEAVIIDINKQKRKISLGIKQLTENPWENLEQKYPIGSIVEGEVSKITDFGAFVKLPSGIEGLVHISELAHHNVHKVEDVLSVGQKTQFKVIKINQEEHRLGLSLKTEEEEKKPKRTERPTQRTKHVEATVTVKPKSQLQLELEKHAARSTEEEK
ncbi:MAG: 30S ribosomal protein S1 [Candidatus Babeliaceae bacterium]